MNLDILTLLTEGRQNGLAPGNITATALRRSSAKKLTYNLPYFGMSLYCLCFK